MPITWRTKASMACHGCHQTKLRCVWVKDGLGQPLPCGRCTANGSQCEYPLKPTTCREAANKFATSQSMQGVADNSDAISAGQLAALPQPQQFTSVEVVAEGHVGTHTNGVAIAGPNYYTGPEVNANTIHDFDMPLPDNLGQILCGAMAVEAGSQFTALGGCMCSEIYPSRCAMHTQEEPSYAI